MPESIVPGPATPASPTHPDPVPLVPRAGRTLRGRTVGGRALGGQAPEDSGVCTAWVGAVGVGAVGVCTAWVATAWVGDCAVGVGTVGVGAAGDRAAEVPPQAAARCSGHLQLRGSGDRAALRRHGRDPEPGAADRSPPAGQRLVGRRVSRALWPAYPAAPVPVARAPGRRDLASLAPASGNPAPWSSAPGNPAPAGPAADRAARNRRLAKPVRPGTGRDPGRIPACQPDGAVDDRTYSAPDQQARPGARRGPPASGQAGDRHVTGERRPGDDRHPGTR